MWSALPTTSGQAATYVLGQTNTTNSSAGTTASTLSRPNSVYSDGTTLFVADSANNRVLVWNSMPTVYPQKRPKTFQSRMVTPADGFQMRKFWCLQRLQASLQLNLWKLLLNRNTDL